MATARAHAPGRPNEERLPRSDQLPGVRRPYPSLAESLQRRDYGPGVSFIAQASPWPNDTLTEASEKRITIRPTTTCTGAATADAANCGTTRAIMPAARCVLNSEIIRGIANCTASHQAAVTSRTNKS